MKKLYVVLIVMLAMTLITGCKSTPPSNAGTPAPAKTVVLAPDWYYDVPEKTSGEIWGVGHAKLENSRLALEAATAMAQRDAAGQISREVKTSLNDWAEEAGLANNARSLMKIDNVAKNLIDMNLSNATVTKRGQSTDGTWYIRVSVEKGAAIRQVNQTVVNEMADFADFKADQALRRLEYQLNNSQTKPGQ